MKNNKIQFWRIIFTYIIASYHLKNEFNQPSSWYIAVEFFFILSGYLLISKFEHLESKKEKPICSAWEYTWGRFKGFFPHHLFSFLVAFAGYILIKGYGLLDSIRALLHHLWVVFLVQMIGLNVESYPVNGHTWYLSVLLIVGYFMWYMLKNHKKFYVELIVPFSIIFIYAYLYRTYGDVNEHYETLGMFLNSALLRGWAALNCGILAYCGSKKMGTINWTRSGKRLMGLLSILGFTAVIVGSALVHKTTYDFLFIAILTISVMLTFAQNSESKIYNNVIVKKMAILCYPIYLNHKMFRTVFEKIFEKLDLKVYVIYIVMITVYSMITYVFVEKIFTKLFTKLFERWRGFD